MKKILFPVLLVLAVQLHAQQSKDTVTTITNITLPIATGILYGSVSVPSGPGKFPLVLIIAGSGPTDRNGNSKAGVNSNSYKILADSLLQYGIASLRYDKRGVAESAAAMGKEDDIRFADMVNDAASWLALMKKDKRFSSIVVAGHSEGSLIGMLAAALAGADKYISIAGAGLPAADVLKQQMQAQPKQVQELCIPRLDTLAMGKKLIDPPAMLYSLFRPSIQPYLIDWFSYDPRKAIAALKIPLLVINGTADIQVSVADANSLHKANPKSQLVIIEGMSHLLKEAPVDRTKNIALYNTTPNEPVKSGLVQAIIKFIQRT